MSAHVRVLQVPGDPRATHRPPTLAHARPTPQLAGMTGTAATEVSEFDGIYKLPVAVVPTNRPLSRTDNPDVVFRLEKYKWTAVVTEITRVHAEVRRAGCGGRIAAMPASLLHRNSHASRPHPLRHAPPLPPSL